MPNFRFLPLFLPLLIALALWAPTRPVAAEECATCHDETVETSVHAELDCKACHSAIDEGEHPGGKPAAAVPCTTCHAQADTGNSVHGSLGCDACHGAAHTVAAPSEDACTTCHDVAVLAASVHANVKCRNCHGAAHAVRAHLDPGASTFPLHQFETCGRCHVDDASDPIGRYLSSAHARALLLMGLGGAPSCTSCHGSHDVLPFSDPASRLNRSRAPETCGTCHGFVLETWSKESRHGALWREGSPDGPVCTDCHSSHQAQHMSEREVVVLKSPELCKGCHGGRYSTYRDSFHGKTTSLGFRTAATCSDCHTPHRNEPADDPRSSIYPARLRETCGRCHKGVAAAFFSFNPHADPKDAEGNPELHWVWLSMTTLLFGVFGFFGVHDLLWLQRSIVAVWRGEIERGNLATGPYVRRFSSGEVMLHGTVVVSFLLLAATGLPLKFHTSDWAQLISRGLGGVEVTRFLHRLAAIVTLGYAAFHVFSLFYGRFARGEKGQLWGWSSMVPQPRDIVHLLQNLRYFVYAGPRPRLDRWTYWEKFDYFAVFWGIPVIGGSGLILWFPEIFSHVLPGWVLNAAAVVHSDEALLAVGFIFLFHFFHAHLRPESFPFDPVIFTGSMPLERFREERPLEYQRLVDSGGLASRLVDPPSPQALRRARIFGWTALIVGLVLVLGVFWSMFTML